jgi:malate dehydrogenase (oxaloacetate-decarboxylating)
MLASVTQAIADVGGNLGQITLVDQTLKISTRDLTVDATSTEHAEQIVQAVKALTDIKLINVYDRTFNLHRGGKISMQSKLPLHSQADLAMAYTPGVGRICNAIAKTQNRFTPLPSKATLLPLSPMAVLYWGWETWARRQRCR